jgi:hypothetical protein
MSDFDPKREPLAPPPVEPLSDIAWARVERQLFATLDCDNSAPIRVPARSWPRWAIAGGALALAAAAAVILVVASSDDAAKPAEVAATRPATAAPSRVVTQDAPSSVTFGDAAIEVAAHSAVTLHGAADDGVLVMLERGAATFEVAPREARPAFVVQAGEVTVRVVGTRFTVERSGDAARVDVIEGHVEVVARGLRVQVLAGESWSTDGDREAAIRGSAAPPVDIAAAPFDPPVVEPKPEPKPKAKAPAPTYDPRVAFERVAALEASDPAKALAEYKKLARYKGPWAANALYAAGRLAAELGRRDEAIQLLERYLDKYSSGGNAADARALLRSLAP